MSSFHKNKKAREIQIILLSLSLIEDGEKNKYCQAFMIQLLYLKKLNFSIFCGVFSWHGLPQKADTLSHGSMYGKRKC